MVLCLENLVVLPEECDEVRSSLLKMKNGLRKSEKSVHSQSCVDCQAENQVEKVVHQLRTA